MFLCSLNFFHFPVPLQRMILFPSLFLFPYQKKKYCLYYSVLMYSQSLSFFPFFCLYFQNVLLFFHYFFHWNSQFLCYEHLQMFLN